ncbi:MAG: hypothetical protein WAU81_02960 [Candidatus Aminicenantales bacterium]
MKKEVRNVFLTLSLLAVLLVTLGSVSCHALRFRRGARAISEKITRQEVANGVRPEFNVLPKGWINPLKQDMNHIWEPLGLKGMNYFTFGGPKSLLARFAERTNPHSKFYQAWFGVYIIQTDRAPFGMSDGVVDIDALGDLAEYDQRAWLKAMGDPIPEAEWVAFAPRDALVIDGRRRPFFDGTIISHSDLPELATTPLAKFLGTPPASRWHDDVTPHHDLTLKGIYGAWYSEDYGMTIVVYGCGSLFRTLPGDSVNHYERIREELVELAEGIRLVPCNGMP